MHVNSSWTSRFEIEDIAGKGSFHRIKKHTRGILASYHNIFISLVLNTGINSSKEYFLRKIDVNGLAETFLKGLAEPYTVNFSDTIPLCHTSFRESMANDMNQAEDGSGLSDSELFATLDKVKNVVSQQMASMKQDDLKVDLITLDKTIASWEQFGYAQIVALYCDGGDKIIEVHDDLFKETPLALKGLDCGRFAFIYLKDKHFLEYAKTHDPSSLYNEGYFDLLRQWNYQPVKEPQRLDLVVYLSDRTVPGKLIPQHFGVYEEDGQIISKKGGKNVDVIFKHDIDSTASTYGNRVAFFRKRFQT